MRSVSARLAFLFLILVSALLGLFSASLWLWVRASLQADLDRELELQSRMFQRLFLEEYEELQRGDPVDLPREMQTYLDIAGAIAEIRRPDGTVLFSSRGFAPGLPGFRFASGPIRDASGEGLSIRFGIDETPFSRPLRQLGLYFAFFLPAALALAWVTGLLFARRALAPVEEIRRRAERISRVNLDERIPEPPITGEFLNLARTFNEMLDRLQKAIEDLRNFAADAAHEIRTPLANLRAEIETALQHSQTPEDQARTLASLLEEVGRMNRIVGDLFTLAQLDMRQYALRKEPVRLADLVREVRETWEGPAAEQGIRVEAGEGDALVEGDRDALRRILMNLVENAVRYNRPGGRVTVSVQRSDGKVRLQVADTGIGIPPESLPLLFRRFYRVDKARSRQSGGTGLGLAICKSFAEAHGGKIDVSSTPGEGTVFTVELPESPQGSVQKVNPPGPPR